MRESHSPHIADAAKQAGLVMGRRKHQRGLGRSLQPRTTLQLRAHLLTAQRLFDQPRLQQLLMGKVRRTVQRIDSKSRHIVGRNLAQQQRRGLYCVSGCAQQSQQPQRYVRRRIQPKAIGSQLKEVGALLHEVGRNLFVIGAQQRLLPATFLIVRIAGP